MSRVATEEFVFLEFCFIISCMGRGEKESAFGAPAGPKSKAFCGQFLCARAPRSFLPCCCPAFERRWGTKPKQGDSGPLRAIKMYPINWTRKFLFYTHKSWIPQSCGHTSCKFIATTPLFWWLVPFLHRMYIHISFPFHRWCDIVISMKWRKTL